MKRIVIGLVGPIASGKGVLADYLKDHGFYASSLSDRVREEVDRRGLKRVRETLQDVGNELRETFGASILARRTAEMIPPDEDLIVIEGVRNPMEIDYLKATLGAQIVAVDAKVELRLGWYLARAKQRGEDGLTEVDFWRANNRDLGLGESLFGQQGQACLTMADVKIGNDGTEKMLLEGKKYLLERFGLDLEGRRKEKERV